MVRQACLLFVVVVLTASSLALPTPHIVVLGRWHTAKISDSPARSVQVRWLLIDGRPKEYTVGRVHEVTDRLFVIERAYRINDSLPEESGKGPRWTWQLGNWISVDRITGHIAQLNLPAFDPFISEASWYRDYAAYCGPLDDGSKAYMVVFQIGNRKPVLKKQLAGSSCPAPKWERDPVRVTFAPPDGPKATFTVQGRSADLEGNSGEEEGPR